jgi:formylglycine-generating enzyme
MAVMSGCASAVPTAGVTRDNSTDGLRYVWVAPGDFQQGCSKFDEDCADDEKPSHKVTIDKGFWISQTEVTVEAYSRFAAATRRAMPPEPVFGGRALNSGWSDRAMPIVNIDWGEGRSYCEWVGGRLPTESEWEYAARAGTADSRSGQLRDVSWFADNAGTKSLDSVTLMREDGAGFLFHLSRNGNTFQHVAQKASNHYGLYDMLGNVWEWTADWYDAEYYKRSPRSNPSGSLRGDTRILRGGCWADAPTALRVSTRGRRPPATRSIDTGFRCVW